MEFIARKSSIRRKAGVGLSEMNSKHTMLKSINVLETALFRKRRVILVALTVASLISFAMESIGRANERNACLNWEIYKAQELKGWRFSIMPLPTGYHAIDRRHLRVVCSEMGHSLQPCNAPETYEHSETIRFLWLTWKIQFPQGECPSDVGHTLHLS